MVEDKRKLVEEVTICPECKGTHIVKDLYRGEIVCEDCGLVIDEEMIDYAPEWRAFDKEERDKKAHTGAPVSPLIHDGGLTTEISYQNRDSYGRPISNKTRAQIYRLRKWQRRIRMRDSTDRNIAEAFSQLMRVSSIMNLPRNVRETAAMIYKKAAEMDLIRGRTIDGMLAAAIYAACRQCHVPRTFDEISMATNIPKKEIGRNYRFLARELKLHILPASPMDYLTRFGNKLKLSVEAQAKAKEILDQAEQERLTIGQNPIGLVAASLYMASVLCGDKKTQKEIAEKIGVTEVTIRNKYKQLSKKLGIDIAL
ncbi:MAG: transcription initiation factor IIB [Thermoplasmata archaeon]|nr:MAG: transcription initiation factor IIB [Thermoplasmata archaeon]